VQAVTLLEGKIEVFLIEDNNSELETNNEPPVTNECHPQYFQQIENL
jgi:hypothetical protein